MVNEKRFPWCSQVLCILSSYSQWLWDSLESKLWFWTVCKTSISSLCGKFWDFDTWFGPSWNILGFVLKYIYIRLSCSFDSLAIMLVLNWKYSALYCEQSYIEVCSVTRIWLLLSTPGGRDIQGQVLWNQTFCFSRYSECSSTSNCCAWLCCLKAVISFGACLSAFCF